MVYHPNIDLEGNVCLNILREDWKPVLTINSIVYGLQYLFLEPNPEDPLNKEAAEVLQNNRRLFEQNVVKSMKGGYIGNVYFDRCLKWGGNVAATEITILKTFLRLYCQVNQVYGLSYFIFSD